MKVVIQRVNNAEVDIPSENYNQSIENGLMVLLGIENEDNADDINWLTNKIVSMRIFNDSDGIMNLSINDIGGSILLVSQFTLQASTKKGNRPSYIKAAKPEIAVPIYNSFIIELTNKLMSHNLKTGIFGADMKISLINDGPVTIIMDSKNRV